MLATAPLALANCGTEADNPPQGSAGSGGGAGTMSAAAGSMSAGGSTAGTATTGGSATAGSAGLAGSGSGGGGSGGVATAGSGGVGNGGTAGAGGAGGSGGAGQGGVGGSNAGAAGQAGSGQGGGGSLALESSKLAGGSMFASDFTCAGDNHSPPLSWKGAPAATLSYAMVLKDTSNMMVHWVMWDIAPGTTQLSEDTPTGSEPTMPAGAKQRAGFGNTPGYQGPCPNGISHTYVFTVYALDVATLPNVTTTTSVGDLVTAIMGHDLASASLAAMSDAKRP